MTLNQLLDAARKNGPFKSDAQLSRALGFTDTMVSQMRRGIKWPSPEKLIRLAEIARRDPRVVLLEMNEQRATDTRERELWGSMKRHFLSAASVVLLTVGVSSTSAIQAQERAANGSASRIGAMYIIENIWRRWRTRNRLRTAQPTPQIA